MYIYANIYIYIYLFILFYLHTLDMLKERMVALLNLIWDRHCKRMGFLSQGKTNLAMRLLMEAWLNMEPVCHLKIAFDTHTRTHIYVYECMFLLKIDLNIIYIHIYLFVCRTHGNINSLDAHLRCRSIPSWVHDGCRAASNLEWSLGSICL